MNNNNRKPSQINDYNTHTIDTERVEAEEELRDLLSQGKDKGVDLVDWYDKWRVCFGDSGVQDIMDACLGGSDAN